MRGSHPELCLPDFARPTALGSPVEERPKLEWPTLGGYRSSSAHEGWSVTRPNYVYVIRFGDYDHKIGISVDPAQRRKSLGPGARTIVKTWRRAQGDARHVERVAHDILQRWRRPTIYSERFTISGETACMAVRLAARLLEDECVLREPASPVVVRSSVAVPDPRRPPPRSHAAAGQGQPILIGYGRPKDVPRLLAAGVPDRRIFVERARKATPALAAARKACRAGDTLAGC